MGKGSGGCDGRTALCVETPSEIYPLADSMQLLPRKERTTWRTADGRFQFTRNRNKWSLTARSIYAEGATADEREQSLIDREALQTAAILKDSYKPKVLFDTLADARQALQTAMVETDTPPVTEITQGNIAYLTTPIPFRITRGDGCWEIGYTRQMSFNIQREINHLYGWKIASMINFITALHSIDKTGYPTRAAAVDVLRDLVRGIETMAQALRDNEAVASTA